MNLSLFFLFFLLSIQPAFSTQPETHSLRLNLIRIPSNPLQTRTDRIRSILLHDQTRTRTRTRPQCLGSKSNTRHSPPPPPPPPESESFAMPMSSGAYTGTGQYFVQVRVGTPAKTFLLVADTGSDLTWVDCKYGKGMNGSGWKGKRVFDADRSRTFRPISCSSEMCLTQLPFALTECPSPTAPCSYDYGYSDRSTAQGFFAKESATIALSNSHKEKLKNLIIGCTSSSAGSSFRSSDGVLGLGYSSISFASRATAHFGGRFSYCLVDHLSPKNTSGYITFGPNDSLNSSAAHLTQLLFKPDLETFYTVQVIGISVAGEVLKIPRSVWNIEKDGGAILDSGTSLTLLAEPAYEAVVTAVSRRLRGIPRVDVDPFEVCYNWTNVDDASAPELIFHFNGRARLKPPAKSYLIDVEDGVKCIGFASAPWPGVSTIGNIMQQEHIWEFDIRNRQLRFQRSKCNAKLMIG